VQRNWHKPFRREPPEPRISRRPPETRRILAPAHPAPVEEAARRDAVSKNLDLKIFCRKT